MITRLAKAFNNALGKRSVHFWRRCAHHARRMSGWVHFMQFDAEYRIPPMPEAFDAYMNQHWQWTTTGESYWLERGVFNRLAMAPGARVLDLCCGLGHYTRHFYAVQASEVFAVDFDVESIERAKRYNSCANIKYSVMDILADLPDGPFNNVVWDSAIEHFTHDQIRDILRRLRDRMTSDGVLSGYTIGEEASSSGSPFHESFFNGVRPLRDVLATEFKNVKVFETHTPSRKNLYFYASDGTLPFDPEWSQQVQMRADGRPALAGRASD